MKYTIKQVEDALIATKGLMSLAAERLGCERKTVYNYVNRYKRLQEARDDAREKIVDTAELALMNAIHKGEGWAVGLVLKTLGRNRGYVERQEIKMDLSKLTDEELTLLEPIASKLT